MTRPGSPAPARRRPPAGLPAYALYGEGRGVAPSEPLHLESIAERSRRHDWEIRPHRHGALFQLLLLRRGRAEASLDGVARPLRGPAVVTVPALAAHGFVFDADVDGAVVTVADAHLARLLGAHPGVLAALRQLRGWALPRAAPATRAVLAAAAALQAEHAADAAWRPLGLDAALTALLLALARAAPAGMATASTRVRAAAAPPPPDLPAAPPPPRALGHVQRLRALVDARFRQQPTVAALAAEIGLTPTQLNRACRQVLGQPARSVLHERLLREAQRELAYTSLSLKRIALDLGFCDAAYFTRFVQQRTGRTPSAWRRAMAT